MTTGRRVDVSRIELHRLRYFIAVAEELNFGRAANRLNIAQPPLSQQIAKLEAEIGAQLFHRTKHSVALTVVGALFLKEAQATLDQAARAVDVARRAARGEIGEISIGYSAAADLEALPRLAPAFRRLYPDARLHFRLLYQAEQIAALRNGTIDVGFLRLPLAEADAHDLDIATIIREQMVAILPEGHRLARRAAVDIADLAEDRYLVFPRRLSPGYFDAIIRAFADAGLNPEVVQLADHPQFNLSLIAMGEGVSMLGDSIRRLRREGVVYVPMAPNPFVAEMGMISRKGDRSEPLARFRRTAAQVFEVPL
jgi:DNA-binding transcriptional LysR family regulator